VRTMSEKGRPGRKGFKKYLKGGAVKTHAEEIRKWRKFEKRTAKDYPFKEPRGPYIKIADCATERPVRNSSKRPYRQGLMEKELSALAW